MTELQAVSRIVPQSEKDQERVAGAMKDLNDLHTLGLVRKLIYVRFDDSNQAFTLITGNMSMEELAFGIACLERELRRLMGP